MAQSGGSRARRSPDLKVVAVERYSSWDEIYLDNVVRIHRLMYAKVGNRPDAEDLTAEVFTAALGPLRIEASRGEVRAYLLTTAQTVLATFWRRRLGIEVTTIDPSDVGDLIADPQPESNAATTTTTVRAKRVLATLPARYRRILELRFLEAHTIKEAAREMEVTVTNAKVLQHRALRMAALADEGWAT